MVVAEETLVVTEHQQQVKPPEHHIELHKGYDAGVACHGLGGYHLTLCAENDFLNPCDEVATVAGAEHIHRHHHHP